MVEVSAYLLKNVLRPVRVQSAPSKVKYQRSAITLAVECPQSYKFPGPVVTETLLR